MADIQSLPDELLHLLMGFVGTASRWPAAAVCRRWLAAAAVVERRVRAKTSVICRTTAIEGGVKLRAPSVVAWAVAHGGEVGQAHMLAVRTGQPTMINVLPVCDRRRYTAVLIHAIGSGNISVLEALKARDECAWKWYGASEGPCTAEMHSGSSAP